MCGILGGNNSKWNYEEGIQAMRHRGPDGQKVVRKNNFTLAFARLSIIDLSDNGMQPMFSQDGQVGIVFNGEIYGYKKLRKYLIKKGYNFRSASDTEVILNAYLEWGEQFITKIDGMYGIAVWDNRDHKVRLFRDRFGIKPLYYFYDGKNFAFSSELKGLVTACGDNTFEIDNTAIFDYLYVRYIPEPKSMYKNVYKLLPAHRLIFDIDDKKIVKDSAYWKLEVNPYQGTQRKKEDIIEELRYLIRNSIKEQMIADVPVGTFLSGGVDSSIVTYECKKINPAVESFSIGFDEKEVDESRYALYFAKEHEICSNAAIFRKKDIMNQFDKLKKWYDEPFADDSAFPTFLVSKLAKDKVTVILTGDGGDEIFGGYVRYGNMWRNADTVLPGHIQDMIDRMLIKVPGKQNKYFDRILQHYTLPPSSSSERKWRELLRIPKDYDKYWMVRKYYHTDLPPITRCQYLDLNTYLPGDILTKVDRVAMAVSLETRVPLLSRKIVEFAFSLSEDDRCPDGNLKGLLKSAYEDEMGKKFLNRLKQGFGISQRYYDKRYTVPEEILIKVWGIGEWM